MSVIRALLLCSSLQVALASAGGRVVVSQKFPDYAAGKIVRVLESAVTQLAIPDISGKSNGFQYQVNDLHISSLSCTSPSLTFVEDTGFRLDLEGISLKGKANWAYKFDVWPHLPFGHGSADVESGSNSHARATLKATVVNNRPQFQIQSIDVDIGSFAIKVHGSIFSWLYNIIVDSWEHHITRAINHAVTSALESQTKVLNGIIAGFDFTENIPLPAPYNKTAIDFSITSLQTLADRMVADDVAEMYPTDGHPRFNGTAPNIPLTNFTEHHIKLELSSYLFDTAFYSFTSEDLLWYLVTSDIIPKSSPVRLTTDAFSVFAPGLLRYHGMDMSIRASTVPRNSGDSHSVDFQGGIITATLPGSFAFNVMNSSLVGPAFTLECPLKIQATLDVRGKGNNQSLAINVASASCDPLTVASSAVGSVHADGWLSIESAVETAISLIRPQVNKALAPGLLLPSVEGVSLANTETKADGGKLEIQTDFEFDFGKASQPVYEWPSGFADGQWWAQKENVALFV